MRRSSDCFKKIIYTDHATDRMFERNIEDEDVKEALKTGIVIESRPDAKPNACCLVLGKAKSGTPLHVAVAFRKNLVLILTVYQPEVELWGLDLKTKGGETNGM